MIKACGLNHVHGIAEHWWMQTLLKVAKGAGGMREQRAYVSHGSEPVSGSLSSKRDEYRRLLEVSLEEAVFVISKLDGVERVSLVGSYAKGRADLFTDLDLVVIMQTDLSFIDRLKLIYGNLCLPVDVDVLCYTPEEFEKIKAKDFFRNLLKDEVVLYERKRV